MKNKAFWALLGMYGVWFAIFSGIEELFQGKYWKVVVCLVLGALSLYTVRDSLKQNTRKHPHKK